MTIPEGFISQALGDGITFCIGTLPPTLLPGAARFENLWALHPEEFHEIRIIGRKVRVPRWQQAYGHDYHFTGEVNEALALPDSLVPFLNWTRAAIDRRLNGILVNWYDGRLGHYIGKHRDSTKGLITGSPIVTISLGAERTFRLRPWRGKGFVDYPARQGSVFITPWETNQAWTHEVLRGSSEAGRRISVTVRAFAPKN